jgi:oxygen-independent coproporphyrinogen-3 oxidase
VIYEEDTPLFEQLKAGEFSVNEELACAMYDELVERAGSHGFAQYEVANFARGDGAMAGWSDGVPGCHRSNTPTLHHSIPRHACRHNINYWRGGSFAGSVKCDGLRRGVRTKNWANTQRYCEQLENGKRAIESKEELPPLSRAGETAAFGLRMVAGWPFEEFRHTTGHDLRDDWAADMDTLVKRGWALCSPERFHLTSAGLRFADAAAELFLR